ncbi:hypothetical protein ES707_10618 [subsurface metagenome]
MVVVADVEPDEPDDEYPQRDEPPEPPRLEEDELLGGHSAGDDTVGIVPGAAGVHCRGISA